MRFGQYLVAAIAAFASIAVVAHLLFFSPKIVENSPARRPPLPDRHPVASTPDPPDDEFARPHRHRKRLAGDGVETEADFIGEVRAWARRDPEAALAWAQQQPDSDDARREALTDACFQIVQTDPVRAVTLAERFHLNRDAVLSNLAQQWATQDPATAARWVSAQSEGDERNALIKGVTLPWSQTDPAAAAQFVVDEMSPGAAFDASLTMVIHQWATTDPDGATRWVQRYPAGPLHDQLTDELAHAAPPRL